MAIGGFPIGSQPIGATPQTAGGSPASYTLSVTSGAISLTGSNVALRAALRLSVSSTAINLTGSNVRLAIARRLAVTSAAVTLAGSNVTLTYAPVVASNVLAVTSAQITLAGSNARLAVARRLAVTTNAIALAGSTVTLTYTPAAAPRILTVTSGQIRLSGSNVDLRSSRSGGGNSGEAESESWWRSPKTGRKRTKQDAVPSVTPAPAEAHTKPRTEEDPIARAVTKLRQQAEEAAIADEMSRAAQAIETRRRKDEADIEALLLLTL